MPEHQEHVYNLMEKGKKYDALKADYDKLKTNYISLLKKYENLRG